jgi:hypothetical protein
VNARDRHSSPQGIELAVAAHVLIFVVGVSWAFGGNADWVRIPISIWGSAGILLSIAIATGRRFRPLIIPRTLRWSWPVLVLNAVVAVSCLTPGFKTMNFEHSILLMPVRVSWWIPSATRNGLALRSLWLFDGIYFSCLNVALVVRHRRTIRLVMAIVVGNALVLSIFGIVQKVVGSTGIYFGLVETPHPQFFASFVYDNHWSAFIIIMIGACIGLILRYAHGKRGAGFFRGPSFTGVVVALILAASIPYSGSRACTLLLAFMIVIALIHGAPRISHALRSSGVSTTGTVLGMTISAIVAVFVVWVIAGDVIESRAEKTKEQVTEMWAQGGTGSRNVLYKDTIRMARERPLFGWGMGSYPVVFSVFNTQESKVDNLPVIYHDAHSDWLQSAAEVGMAGTLLIGLSAALPAMALRRTRVTHIPYFLLTGCVFVAAYAMVEFPFGNVAVVLAWWLAYFAAIQYARLSALLNAPS